MAELLISILGSVDPRREQELKLRNPTVACRAAEEIGAELAKQNCRIKVSCPGTPEAEFVEALVVRGYVESGIARKMSVEVHRPMGSPLLDFAEEATHRDLFRYELKTSKAPASQISDNYSLARICGGV